MVATLDRSSVADGVPDVDALRGTTANAARIPEGAGLEDAVAGDGPSPARGNRFGGGRETGVLNVFA